jgi:hypothetical protein
VPTPFHERADFDGNAVEDDAWIVLREEPAGWGLIVFPGPSGAPGTLLFEEEGATAQNMMMAIVPPGEHVTACGKGYGRCAPSEPRSLTLRLPAIRLSAYESASSFFWWETESRTFKRTWISD